MSERNAADIGQVLPDGQAPAHKHARKRFVAVTLVDQFLDFAGEVLGISVGPPVAEITVGIEVAAAAVEAMGHLMTDNSA